MIGVKHLYLSGGGSLGAYQAGALIELYERGYLESLQSISGNSVGALNGLLIASGYEAEIEKIWTEEVSGLISPFNKLLAPIRALFKGYLLSTRPLKKLLRCYLKTPPFRPFSFGVTSLQDGFYYHLQSTDFSPKELEKALLASAANPVIMPEVRFIETLQGKRIYRASDGGIRNPLFAPKPKPGSLAIYAAPCHVEEDKGSGLLNVLRRYQDLQRSEIQTNDRPNIAIIQPEYLEFKQTDFSPETIRSLIAKGRADARAWMKRP